MATDWLTREQIAGWRPDPAPPSPGDALSRADLAVCAVLDQVCLRQLTPAEADAVEGSAALAAFRARVHERAPDAASGRGLPDAVTSRRAASG